MMTTTYQAAPQIGVAFRQLIAALLAPLQRSAEGSRTRTPAEDAEEVRELAAMYLTTDPGFANDLFAAADRHEREALAAEARNTLQ